MDLEQKLINARSKRLKKSTAKEIVQKARRFQVPEVFFKSSESSGSFDR